MQPDKHLTEELIQEVEKRFGKTLNTQKDLQLLKTELEEEYELIIGFNTLRRFFGNLENRNPQLSTLNILSEYLGFVDFIDFTRHHNQNDEWSTWKQMSCLENKAVISNEDTNWLNSIKLKHEFPIMISYLLKTYISNNLYNNFEALFKSNCLSGLTYANQMKIGNSLGVYFRKVPLTDLKKLAVFLRYETFRNFALYLFVDYDSFYGYYGYFIRESKKHLSEADELLFNKLITNYSKWLSVTKTTEQILPFQIKHSIHPVLLGRYFGYRIISTEKNERKILLKEMLLHVKKSETKILFFFEVIPALILTKELKTISLVLDLYYTELFDLKQWQQKDEESLYLIGLSLVEISKKHYQNAIKLLQRIDFSLLTNSYQSYTGLFYKIAEFHAQTGLNINRAALLKIESAYLQLAKQTGFKRFSKEFLKNYFSLE